MKAFLEQVLNGQDLTADQVSALFNAMLAGELDPNFIAGMLIALRAKGESVVEIASAAKVMRAHAVAIPSPSGQILVDTCGTGGDLSGTFNLSTAAAITVATMGAKVAKHGNRSVSSKAGSADVLEALGVQLGGPPERLAEILQDVGISFLFAPAHHASTRHAVGPRKALGVRTIFNLLGPLTNPAGAPPVARHTLAHRPHSAQCTRPGGPARARGLRSSSGRRSSRSGRCITPSGPSSRRPARGTAAMALHRVRARLPANAFTFVFQCSHTRKTGGCYAYNMIVAACTHTSTKSRSQQSTTMRAPIIETKMI